jgi:chorismate mutase/GNAT superfamily N-acetyltransferase
MRSEPDEPAELVLRAAGPDDARTLAELFLAAREAAFPAMPRSVHGPGSVRAWFDELLGHGPDGTPPTRETWVAERAGRVVGYLVLDGSWLDSLYVAPSETGQGIGTVLVDLVKGLRPGGFSLWVFESNVRARTFYERHGLLTIRCTDGSQNEEGAPDRELAWLGVDPVATLRARVDATDDALAELLEQRLTLTGLIQEHKPVGGQAGRDPEREEEIVQRMSGLAPRLGADRLRRIMQTVITEGLDAVEDRRAREQPPAT